MSRATAVVRLITATALVCITQALSGCSKEPALPALDAATHQSQWDAWKAHRLQVVTSPAHPMFYSGLRWLKPGPNTVGGDSTSYVTLTGKGVPKQVGTLIRDGFAVRFEPAPKAPVKVDSQPAAAGRLRTDADSGNPSIVDVGTAGFKIVKRVDSIGVRSWDSEAPSAKAFKGLDYFPLDPAWRVAGHLVPLDTPKKVPVMTESGVAEEYTIVGHVAATLGGTPYNLLAYTGNNATDLFFTFSDESSGDETYGFRFLHAPLDTVTKLVTLDFNYAYNPDCAFSPFTTCPLPTAENKIHTKMLVGEKKLVHN